MILLVSVLFIIQFSSAVTIVINATQNANYLDGDVSNTPLISDTATSIEVGGGSLSAYRRGFIDFNTSVIPDGVTIVNVTLNLTLGSYLNTASGLNITIYGLNQTADSLIDSSAQTVLRDMCGGGAGSATFVINATDWNALNPGDNRGVVLGTNASQNLSAYLTQDFFSVCLQVPLDNTVGNNRKLFNSSEAEGGIGPKLTVEYTILDTTVPDVTIISPINTTYGVASYPAHFNVTLSENGSVSYSLNGGANNFSMTGNESLLFGTVFNATNTTLGDGSYTFRAYANDTSNNRNYTEGIVFSVDRTSPGVTINLPTSTTKTVNNYLINLTLSESGYCEYSLDGGSTNETLTNNGNIDFNSTEISVANADYTLAAYCNDSIGNRNYTTNVSFSVSVSSGGGGETPGGGGGGGTTCSATTWTCGAWGICFDGKQTRECTSNCNTKRTETQSCSLTCEHDTRCSQEGVFCSGNEVVTCELNSEGCLDFVSSVVCEDDEICSNAQCVLKGKNAKNIFSGLGHWGNYSTPSDWIPHGNIPDIVIDAGAGVVSVGVIGGIIWWIVLLVIGSIVPFFLIKLRHYSVSVIDFSNKLNMFEGERLNHGILEKFINTLEETYGKMTIANANYEVLRLLGARGFVEIRIDSPFAIIGHFSNKKDCELFENGLKKALGKTQGGAKIQVTKKIERASIIGAWRAYRRKLRSQREIRKLVR